MRNRYLAALICAVALAAAGCSGAITENGAAEAAQSAEAEADTSKEQTAGTTEDAAAEVPSEGETVDSAEEALGENSELGVLSTAAGETFESEDGWSVRYDSDLVTVNEGEDETEFVYSGEANGTNELVISYIPNTSTDVVLAEKTEEYDRPAMERSEGYFAGRADIWAFSVDLIRESWESTLGYTAVEHNDGVLLVEKIGSRESDEERAALISNTMAAILDSFEFDDHEPQTEYDYIPGKYVLNMEVPAEEEAAYPAWLVLDEDHTGQIGGENPVDIVWYSRDGIIKEDTEGGDVRFFHIEGDALFLEQGNGWIEFRKDMMAGSSAAGKAADSRISASFRTYENGNGWLVYYDSDLFTIEEGYNETTFIYENSEDEAGRLKIEYIEDDSTEDVLEDIAEDYDIAQIEQSEGYLGGSSEDWSFTLSVPVTEGAGVRKVYTAAEHNGGVLLAERLTSGENASEGEKAIEGIVSSFLFTDHDPQWEYEDIPGRYLLNDKILSKAASNYPQVIDLNWDHTGAMSGQDEVPIIWHCRDGILQEAAAGGKTYQYYIEDDVLYLQLDEEWVQFDREEN